jgi:hypothetical protein
MGDDLQPPAATAPNRGPTPFCAQGAVLRKPTRPLQPRPSSCLVTAQYFWRKTSAWFSVIPAAVVTTLRLSPQLTKRRDPFDAIWL